MTGAFVGLDATTLTELKTEYVACLKAIAVAGQSYAIGQRNFTRADLKAVSDTISEINFALGKVQGTRTRVTIDNFNPTYR